MRLRATLQDKLPLGEDEVHLSPSASKVTFRGSYLLPTTVSNVEQVGNYSERSRDAYPYKVKVTRTCKDGTKSISGDSWDSCNYRNPKEIVDEMANPAALNRATRIEKVARRIKVATASAAVLGIVVGSIFSGLSGHEDGQPEQTPATASVEHAVQPCENIVQGTETLTPISQENIGIVQKAGGMVCVLAGQNYLAIS